MINSTHQIPAVSMANLQNVLLELYHSPKNKENLDRRIKYIRDQYSLFSNDNLKITNKKLINKILVKLNEINECLSENEINNKIVYISLGMFFLDEKSPLLEKYSTEEKFHALKKFSNKNWIPINILVECFEQLNQSKSNYLNKEKIVQNILNRVDMSDLDLSHRIALNRYSPQTQPRKLQLKKFINENLQSVETFNVHDSIDLKSNKLLKKIQVDLQELFISLNQLHENYFTYHCLDNLYTKKLENILKAFEAAFCEEPSNSQTAKIREEILKTYDSKKRLMTRTSDVQNLIISIAAGIYFIKPSSLSFENYPADELRKALKVFSKKVSISLNNSHPDLFNNPSFYKVSSSSISGGNLLM